MKTTWSSGRFMYFSHKLATRASFAVTVLDKAWVSTRAVATAVDTKLNKNPSKESKREEITFTVLHGRPGRIKVEQAAYVGLIFTEDEKGVELMAISGLARRRKGYMIKSEL
jgi:hypothetical protein